MDRNLKNITINRATFRVPFNCMKAFPVVGRFEAGVYTACSIVYQPINLFMSSMQ